MSEAFEAKQQEYLDESKKARLAQLEAQLPNESERFMEAHRLSDPIYTYCRAADAEHPIERFDLKGHLESWGDMIRLQAAGVYPAAFASIECPVLMLHGSYDPHPGALIRESLKLFLPHLEYLELERCGHSPWADEYARDRFLESARSWLEERLR